MWFDVLSETIFITQQNCSQVQPCVFCKCYLNALSVLIHPTEFIKRSLWARCHADAGKRGPLWSVIGITQCRGQYHNQKMHRALREHWEGGAHWRLGVEMKQRGKPAWCGLEIHVEVEEEMKQRSSLCIVRSVERMKMKNIWIHSVGLLYGM